MTGWNEALRIHTQPSSHAGAANCPEYTGNLSMNIYMRPVYGDYTAKYEKWSQR